MVDPRGLLFKNGLRYVNKQACKISLHVNEEKCGKLRIY